MDPEQSMLKEYEMLRNELLAYFSRDNARLSLVWAGVGAIVGASIYSKIPELSFVALFLALLGWWEHLSIDASVRKIGSYIEVCLESRLPGLNWEGVTHAIDGTYDRVKWSKGKKLSDALFAPYGLTALICLLVVVILQLGESTGNNLRSVGRIALFLFSLTFFVTAIRRDFNRHAQSPKWRKAYKNALQGNAMTQSDDSIPIIGAGDSGNAADGLTGTPRS